MPSVAALAHRPRTAHAVPDQTITNTLTAAPNDSAVSNARTWLLRTERLPFDCDVVAFSSFAAVGVLIPAVLVTVDRYPIIAIACMALATIAATVWATFASRIADHARNIRDITANAIDVGVDSAAIRRIVRDYADDIEGFYGRMLTEIDQRKQLYQGESSGWS